MLPWAYLDGQLQFRKPTLKASPKAFRRHAKMIWSRLSCTGITLWLQALFARHFQTRSEAIGWRGWPLEFHPSRSPVSSF
jgi:hypothetical protein